MGTIVREGREARRNAASSLTLPQAMGLKAEAKRLTGPLPGGSSAGTTVTVEPLLTGTVEVPPHFLEGKGSGRMAELRMLGLATPRSRWLRIPVPAFLIRHPTAGAVMVDTGLHPSVVAKPAANLGRTTAWFSRPEVEPGEDVATQLRNRDIDPRKVETVLMTHLHLDHSSGISEFPNATFVIAEEEWRAATTDPRPALQGYRHSHYDYLFDYRTIDFDGRGISSYASFGRSFDLFGDGSVRLVYTPGHSAGHCSVVAHLRDNDFVIAGDAIYTFDQLHGGAPPPRPLDFHRWRRSLTELQLFHRNYPDATIVPGHDLGHWSELAPSYS